jgi:Tfp pilus assembly protein PilN
MRKIDFLPESYRESRQRHAVRVRRAWLAGLVLAGLASWFGVEELRLRGVRSQLEYLAGQNKTAMAGLEHIARLQAEQAGLLDRHRLLQELQSPVSSAATVFQIARLLPENVAVGHLQITCRPASAPVVKAGSEVATAEAQAVPPAVPLVSLSGVAASQVDIAVLLGQLSGCREFANVRLDYSKAAEVKGHLAQEFRVTFEVVVADAKAAQANVDALERTFSQGVARLQTRQAWYLRGGIDGR